MKCPKCYNNGDINEELVYLTEPPLDKSSSLTFNSPRVPLDFDALYGKAFKVTDSNGDPNREGFSIVTPVNGAVFNQWKERPEFKEIVRQHLNDPDFLADHKYKQIVDSAAKLGIRILSSRKVALDAMLEEIGDPERAIHQQHSDPDFTTQNGKMMGKGTEVETGALNASIPGSLLASVKCAACEGGDCLAHPGSINALTDSVVGDDDFEIHQASDGTIHVADIKHVADTKSYGAGTPNGGTPSSPPNPPAPITPPMQPDAPQPPPATNPVPPVSTVNKTPIQLSQDAQQDTKDMVQQNQQNGQQFNQQQLSQIVNALGKSAAAKAAGVDDPQYLKITIGRLEQIKKEFDLKPTIVEQLDIDPDSIDDALEYLRYLSKYLEIYMNKSASVKMHVTPTSFPPRDDLKSHLTEEVKDEAMQGVDEPAPQQKERTLVQPQQPIQAPPQTAEQQLLKQTLAAKRGGILYHGTLLTNVGAILREGIKPSEGIVYATSMLDEAKMYAEEKLRVLYNLGNPDELPPETTYAIICISRELSGLRKNEDNGYGRFTSSDPVPPEAIIRVDVYNVMGRKVKSTKTASDKVAVQTEEGVNQVCPACNSTNIQKIDSDLEEGSLVECLECGCFFAM